MTHGPGKYDHFCTHVRDETGAAGVLLIVIKGDKGSGFSCQADFETTKNLPALLEKLAADIRADMTDEPVD